MGSVNFRHTGLNDVAKIDNNFEIMAETLSFYQNKRQKEAAGMSGIVPMPAASVVCRVRRCYFTRPFSRYSARLVRMTAARWSAATLWMSCCTMAGTVVPDGWRRAVRHIDLGDHNIAFHLRGAALTTTTRRISRMLRLTGLLG